MGRVAGPTCDFLRDLGVEGDGGGARPALPVLAAQLGILLGLPLELLLDRPQLLLRHPAQLLHPHKAVRPALARAGSFVNTSRPRQQHTGTDMGRTPG